MIPVADLANGCASPRARPLVISTSIFYICDRSGVPDFGDRRTGAEPQRLPMNDVDENCTFVHGNHGWVGHVVAKPGNTGWLA